MTNNMDEFDHEGIETDASQGEEGGKRGLVESWRSRPLVKLLIIMVVVGVAIAGALGAFSGGEPTPESRLVKPSGISEVPGSKASPFFIEQNQQATNQRVEAALQQGGSAIPTPVGQSVDIGDVIKDPKKNDPLIEFRAETERLKQEVKQEQEQSRQQIQILQQQVQAAPQQPPAPEDQSLAQAMQAQLRQMMDSWVPKSIRVVKGEKDEVVKEPNYGLAERAAGNDASSANANIRNTMTKKPLIMAGTVNYAQMLTEANSDVPGPILAQVLSGPLTGGRAIGHFQVSDDYLVIEFNTITLKGKEYSVNALALDPDTTLGGMATEVDHRYFTRVILPAAGSFVSAFGDALSRPQTETIVTNGAIVTLQAKQGMKDALYAGVGSVGNSVGRFLDEQGARTRTLVRVAVGTPMGLFFLSSVRDNEGQDNPPEREPVAGATIGGVRPAAYQAGAESGAGITGIGQTSPDTPGVRTYGGPTYTTVTPRMPANGSAVVITPTGSGVTSYGR